ncbi:MAG: amidohydrolase family protein [Sphingomonadales bacterium]|nr:amidohydrolase family protein [Sphingomonadales bacterium]
MTRHARRIAGLLTAALSLALPARADTLVTGLDGTSIDAAGGIDHFTGLIIANDGRIAQVLHRGDKPPRADYAVDLHGRSVIPGFVDGDAHVMALGLTTLTLDLADTRTLAEAQARIAAYAAAHPDRGWIIGRGWDAARWGLTRPLTAADLDAALADRPAFLTSADGHAGWANSRALALAHVTAAMPDPAGGRIERGPGHAPGGILVDRAMALVANLLPPLRADDRDLAFANAQDILLRHGITAVTDMGTSIEDWQTYRRAGDVGRLQIRILAYADTTEAMALIGGPGPTPWLYDDRLRLNGVFLTLDGTLAQHSALLRSPYADDPGTRGLALVSDTRLKNLMSRAAIDHFQVAVHAAGDAAVGGLLGAIAELAQTYEGERRWRIEDADVLDAADLALLGQHGAVITMRPEPLATGQAMAEARLGAGRLGEAWAWKSAAASGAAFALATGAPASPPDPFAALATAITREDGDARPFGGWQPQECLTREAALAALTTGAAYAGFAEAHFGRIAVGQRADFLVIDQDPMLASPAALRQTQVLEVWIGGRKVRG